MPHVNGNIPWWDDIKKDEATALQEAKSKFWEETACELLRELRNIPEAIEQHGYWQYRDKDNNTITLRRDA